MVIYEDFTQYNKLGEFYFKQGRKDFTIRGCVCLCFVKYKYRNRSRKREFFEEFVSKSTPFFCNYRKSFHAEKIAIETVNRTERIEHATCIRLELYSSMSPCSKCCMLLQNFLLERPNCEIYITFSSIYRHYDCKQRSALRQLNKVENVKLLDVFTVREWCLLKERGFLSMTLKALREMQKWGKYWREQLKEITHGIYQERPYCEIYIAFSSIYRQYDNEHRSALRQLNKLENVKLLDIFTIKEWCLLKERRFLSMTPKALSEMKIWGMYWREQLKEITTYGICQKESAVYSEDITIDGVEVDYNSYFLTQVNPEKAKKYEEGTRSVTGMLLSLGLFVGLLLTTLYWFLCGY